MIGTISILPTHEASAPTERRVESHDPDDRPTERKPSLKDAHRRATVRTANPIPNENRAESTMSEFTRSS